MRTTQQDITGTIFSIEEFAVNDGPGIRTTIFLKGCPLRCVWCHNPEGMAPEPQEMIKKGEKTICGYTLPAKALAEQILKNKKIYSLHQGGITLTGGEPLFQADFVIDLLKRVRPEVHTAMETSGFSHPSVFQKVLPLLDMVLFDIKHTDPVMHRKYTGVDNRLILENLKTLCASSNPFVVRIPLIPGVNDTTENMSEIIRLLKYAEGLERVEILRYNKMAGAKYVMIGKAYHPPFNTNLIAEDHKELFKENHIPYLIV